MAPIRVLVVEDSLTVRAHLCEVLDGDPELVVVAVAEDGAEAVELCCRERPDVITMDLILPVMSGLAATRSIMAHCPTPILVVSSATNRAELFATYDALAAGAVEILEKPAGDATDDSWDLRLRATVKLVSRIPVVTRHRTPDGRTGPPDPPHGPYRGPDRIPGSCHVVAIGASTGGPGALVEILRRLPVDYRVPVLIVQHIGAVFATSFGDWLDGQIGHRVAYAHHGQSVAAAAGTVLLAPPGRHMVVRDGRMALTTDPERHSCRPSIDTLFESIARAYAGSAVGCVLTGMGGDGAAGLLALRQAGGHTLAQDEETSVVYGMPREAALLGAAEHILPPDQIGTWLASLSRSPRIVSEP